MPKTAGVLLLGTGGFAPAHTTTFFETACMMDDEREIHPFYFRTHTHKLGVGFLQDGGSVKMFCQDNSLRYEHSLRLT